MLNLAVLLEDSARELPDREAVVCGPARMTYAQVDAAASRVAHALAARGIGPGDRVALTCPNMHHFPPAYYGILKTGAAVVPLNVLLTADEIAYHLADAKAAAYLCFEGTPELPMGRNGFAAFSSSPQCREFLLITLDPAAPSPVEGATTLGAAVAGVPDAFPSVPRAETDTAVVLYTSGTTGRPKGAELSHSNMTQNAQVGVRLFESGPHERHLVALPLFHSFGQTVNMNHGFLTGATLVLMPRFDPGGALALMRAESVSMLAAVPTMYWALLNHPDDTHIAGVAENLRVCVSGGAPLTVEILRAFEERFSVPILEGYGLSETSPIATFNRVDRPRKVGSIGLPVWGVRAKIITEDGGEAGVDEPGELCVSGHNVMTGYLDRPKETAEVLSAEGWFRTGDVARRDADGYYYIVDRIKDLIIRAGFNVYPREIEETLARHPGVSLVAVVGVPHERHGEEIKAVVVRKPGTEVTEEELIAWAKERMAAFKYPRTVEFRESLPMTASGKILKRELV
ncbi:long-chain-fatty-acid--CoA ligase [Actinorhabdospora filicis]|uniref:Long-chain-fatty-acid--CoA ligase n=1 Tax=Actinorhabdospora filicis TaxID=1785913 RepID=A0A9W6SR09_9ACTN|nr:long-chain fatty acid--CoA ligase [Actinorhabdospora filicis]GLZ80607.1 long-chain-fatty-acid--CoA ligase [Actinorhabdospora filicis]